MNMFTPQTQQRAPRREAERLKTLAESLQQGGKYKGNEIVSGMVVKQSPLEHLARGLQTAAGGYFAGQAQNKTDEDERALQQRIADALGQWGNPQEAAAILAQDPRTSEMAFKLMQGETDWARQKELAQMRISAMGSGGGNTPAPMQIANQMFELEQMMNNPNLPEEQRFLAERQYNLLGQAAKTYGFDRGLGYGGSMDGYSNVYGGQQQPMGGIPPVDMMPNGEMQAPMSGQVPNGTLNPMQYQDMMQGQQFNDLIGGLTGQPAQDPVPNESVLRVNPPNMPLMPNQYTTMGQQPGQPAQDPVAAHAQAVAMQQQQIGVSPMQRPELSGSYMPPAQQFSPPQLGEVPGYTNLMANRAGQIKQQEAQAQEVGKRLGEAQGTLTFLDANMPKLEEVTNRLGQLADTATYTMAGRGADFLNRELDRTPRQGAVDRAEYIATVDNEVLPLLRDTFGAAFTVKEGESLRATLGDANKSPAEKDAVLKAFINQKKAQVQALQRQTGQQPNIQSTQNPQRAQIMQTLQATGASPDEIEAYLQSRGL